MVELLNECFVINPQVYLVIFGIGIFVAYCIYKIENKNNLKGKR